jgi:hypothetical protein
MHPRTEDGAIIVSQSDLGAFKTDRRTWLLGTYLGLKSREPLILGPLRLGTRVHHALEYYYGYSEDLLEAYKKLVDSEYQDLIESRVVFDERAWQKEIELGRVMLEGYSEYLEETGADEYLEILGAEKVLSHTFDIEGTPVVLRGKVDCRARNTFTNMNLVIDFKTTASFERLIPLAPHSEQLLTYCVLEKLHAKETGDTEHMLQGAMFIMLRKVLRGTNSRPPYYQRIEVHHSEKRLRSFYTQLYGTLRDYLAVVKALDAGVDHRIVAYPNPGWHTRWSPFKHVMEMMDDGSRVEDMIADLYVQSDPHERYRQEKTDLLSQFE